MFIERIPTYGLGASSFRMDGESVWGGGGAAGAGRCGVVVVPSDDQPCHSQLVLSGSTLACLCC